MEPALLDLARAEAELTACEDAGLRCWAHTGLGYGYLELRLYELALPHMVAAQELDASPIPLTQAPVDRPDEPRRAAPALGRRARAGASRRPAPTSEVDDAPQGGPRRTPSGRSPSQEAGNPSFVATCRAMELSSRPRGTPAASLERAPRGVQRRGPPGLPGQPRGRRRRTGPGAVGARQARRGGRRRPRGGRG